MATPTTRKKKNPLGLDLKTASPSSPSPVPIEGDFSSALVPPMKNLTFVSDDFSGDGDARSRFDDVQFNKSKLLNAQELKSEDFVNIEPLGSGNGGVVWKVKHKHSDLVLARKMIHLEIKPKVREQILRELKVLHECNSPEIVGFYGSFFSDMEINILMEYMDCGSLDKVLKRVGRIEEDVVRFITVKVLRGLVYLRDNYKVIHRDVKPSNILLSTRGDVKLCDFGVSGELTNSLANTFVGTRSYMAPERLLGNKYAVESDVWSLGLSVIEIAIGRFPIPVEDPPPPLAPIRRPFTGFPDDKLQKKQPTLAIFELLAHIVEGPPPRLPAGQGFSTEFEDFVAKCCTKDVSQRPQLNSLLEHPFSALLASHPVDMAAWARSTLLSHGPASAPPSSSSVAAAATPISAPPSAPPSAPSIASADI